MTQEATDTVRGGYRMLARCVQSFSAAIMPRVNVPSGMRPPDGRSAMQNNEMGGQIAGKTYFSAFKF